MPLRCSLYAPGQKALRPEFVHEPIHFRPEVAVIFRAPSLPGLTENPETKDDVIEKWSAVIDNELDKFTRQGNVDLK